MNSEALVLRVNGRHVEVRRKTADCAACTSDLCTPKNRTTRATVPDELDVRVDDWVELRYSAGTATVDALLVLGLPILGFVAGYLSAPLLGNGAAGLFQTEAGRALIGLLGLALAGLVPFARKRINPDAGLPSVSRVLRRKPSHIRTRNQTAGQPDALSQRDPVEHR